MRRKIALVIPALVRAGDQLIAHQRVRELYPEYLFASHCVIRASVPLMETARQLAAARADDPVCARLAPYLEHHIPEELHHDDWLLDDLELLGVDRAVVLSHLPSQSVAALVGCQYYWALHYHPVAVLGYIALMEGYPPTPELVEDLIARTGYPREVFRTFAEHGELDPHHRDELDEAIDSLPLTGKQEALLGLSAMSSVEFLARSVEEVLETA